MTKKDYELIARAMSEIHARGCFASDERGCFASDERGCFASDERQWVAVHRMATLLSETNPRFDYNRFIDACGVPV